ncbi:uncharacterized protein STEHIDRAFT_154326 [Stereum hirsutum FP-91666 SS1]|uniref:uncharacterized protein n=1 Tax=Stereum hirsutum (strain FP-91666) TaxID=721885 RepID=UPI0004409F9F|nr:uncharacterized protein STEHIDRAFT_154326 [Stereum hirsutum FP-91666 SS1]EIM90510.1 hypothetical protein STEHIDRAFT_154326 [Stereum hirsutum FP-91666 SS1]
MAGHGYVKHDPAVERWNSMRENVWRYFKFTRQTTKVSLIGLVIFPGAIYLTSTLSIGKWDWKGRRKDETLLRNPPAAVEPTEE